MDRIAHSLAVALPAFLISGCAQPTDETELFQYFEKEFALDLEDDAQVHLTFQKSDGSRDGPDTIYRIEFGASGPTDLCEQLSPRIDVRYDDDGCTFSGRLRPPGAHVEGKVDEFAGEFTVNY